MKRYHFKVMFGVALLIGSIGLVFASDKAISKSLADVDAVVTDVASTVDDEQQYGGIKKQYVVKGCKVTIYNDGPIKMVDEKTDEPCDAPIPENSLFSKVNKIDVQNGCQVVEYARGDAVMDCAKPQ